MEGFSVPLTDTAATRFESHATGETEANDRVATEVDSGGDEQQKDKNRQVKESARKKYKIRTAKREDYDNVARLSALVFDRQLLDEAVDDMGGRDSPLGAITKVFADITYWILIQDYKRNLVECLNRKEKLAPQARQQAKSMTSKYMRYALTKQNDGRMFHVLIAEDVNTAKVVGTVTLFRFPAEATLPPPIPTTKPKRFYASTLAVDPAYRRQGIARRLMEEAEKLASRWGQEYVYLHVIKENIDAQYLYFNCGYELVQEDPWWYFEKRYLLRKKMNITKNSGRMTSLPRMNI